MIKKITQYIAICDNSFCDSTVKSVVDFHSYDRQYQFEEKLKNLGWQFNKKNDPTDQPKFICPNCVLFTSELEKRHPVLRPIKQAH